MANAKMKLKKGDQVIVISGANKGATGEIIKAIPTESRVLVQGVNMRKKHKKPTQMSPGGIEEIEAPIHVSNVALLDPKENKPTRVGYTMAKDGKKLRVAKRSGETVE